MKWLLVIIGIVAAWPLWDAVNGIGTSRYRLTIEIDTPQGPRTGSGVYEVYISPHKTSWGPIEARGVNPKLRGEAIYIDLGDGKQVISLIAHGPKAEGDGFAFLPMRVLGGTWNTQDRLTGTADLKPPFIPTLVTFTDLNDPKTARVVYATTIAQIPSRDASGNVTQYRDGAPIVAVDAFANAFGPGYAFKRATLEMVPTGVWPLNLIGITGTPVTRGIEAKVPFLVTQREPLRRVIRDMPPRFQTGFSQFIRE